MYRSDVIRALRTTVRDFLKLETIKSSETYTDAQQSQLKRLEDLLQSLRKLCKRSPIFLEDDSNELNLFRQECITLTRILINRGFFTEAFNTTLRHLGNSFLISSSHSLKDFSHDGNDIPEPLLLDSALSCSAEYYEYRMLKGVCQFYLGLPSGGKSSTTHFISTWIPPTSKKELSMCAALEEVANVIEEISRDSSASESLYFLILNGTIYIYQMCRFLLLIGPLWWRISASFLTYAAQVCERTLPLATTRYLGWRHRLIYALCEILEKMGDYKGAMDISLDYIRQVNTLMKLECGDSIPPSPAQINSLNQALALGYQLFLKYRWWYAAVYTFCDRRIIQRQAAEINALSPPNRRGIGGVATEVAQDLVLGGNSTGNVTTSTSPLSSKIRINGHHSTNLPNYSILKRTLEQHIRNAAQKTLIYPTQPGEMLYSLIDMVSQMENTLHISHQHVDEGGIKMGYGGGEVTNLRGSDKRQGTINLNASPPHGSTSCSDGMTGGGDDGMDGLGNLLSLFTVPSTEFYKALQDRCFCRRFALRLIDTLLELCGGGGSLFERTPFPTTPLSSKVTSWMKDISSSWGEFSSSVNNDEIFEFPQTHSISGKKRDRGGTSTMMGGGEDEGNREKSEKSNSIGRMTSVGRSEKRGMSNDSHGSKASASIRFNTTARRDASRRQTSVTSSPTPSDSDNRSIASSSSPLFEGGKGKGRSTYRFSSRSSVDSGENQRSPSREPERNSVSKHSSKSGSRSDRKRSFQGHDMLSSHEKDPQRDFPSLYRHNCPPLAEIQHLAGFLLECIIGILLDAYILQRHEATGNFSHWAQALSSLLRESRKFPDSNGMGNDGGDANHLQHRSVGSKGRQNARNNATSPRSNEKLEFSKRYSAKESGSPLANSAKRRSTKGSGLDSASERLGTSSSRQAMTTPSPASMFSPSIASLTSAKGASKGHQLVGSEFAMQWISIFAQELCHSIDQTTTIMTPIVLKGFSNIDFLSHVRPGSGNISNFPFSMGSPAASHSPFQGIGAMGSVGIPYPSSNVLSPTTNTGTSHKKRSGASNESKKIGGDGIFMESKFPDYNIPSSSLSANQLLLKTIISSQEMQERTGPSSKKTQHKSHPTSQTPSHLPPSSKNKAEAGGLKESEVYNRDTGTNNPKEAYGKMNPGVGNLDSGISPAVIRDAGKGLLGENRPISPHTATIHPILKILCLILQNIQLQDLWLFPDKAHWRSPEDHENGIHHDFQECNVATTGTNGSSMFFSFRPNAIVRVLLYRTYQAIGITAPCTPASFASSLQSKGPDGSYVFSSSIGGGMPIPLTTLSAPPIVPGSTPSTNTAQALLKAVLGTPKYGGTEFSIKLLQKWSVCVEDMFFSDPSRWSPPDISDLSSNPTLHEPVVHLPTFPPIFLSNTLLHDTPPKEYTSSGMVGSKVSGLLSMTDAAQHLYQSTLRYTLSQSTTSETPKINKGMTSLSLFPSAAPSSETVFPLVLIHIMKNLADLCYAYQELERIKTSSKELKHDDPSHERVTFDALTSTVVNQSNDFITPVLIAYNRSISFPSCHECLEVDKFLVSLYKLSRALLRLVHPRWFTEPYAFLLPPSLDSLTQKGNQKGMFMLNTDLPAMNSGNVYSSSADDENHQRDLIRVVVDFLQWVWLHMSRLVEWREWCTVEPSASSFYSSLQNRISTCVLLTLFYSMRWCDHPDVFTAGGYAREAASRLWEMPYSIAQDAAREVLQSALRWISRTQRCVCDYYISFSPLELPIDEVAESERGRANINKTLFPDHISSVKDGFLQIKNLFSQSPFSFLLSEKRNVLIETSKDEMVKKVACASFWWHPSLAYRHWKFVRDMRTELMRLSITFKVHNAFQNQLEKEMNSNVEQKNLNVIRRLADNAAALADSAKQSTMKPTLHEFIHSKGNHKSPFKSNVIHDIVPKLINMARGDLLMKAMIYIELSLYENKTSCRKECLANAFQCLNQYRQQNFLLRRMTMWREDEVNGDDVENNNNVLPALKSQIPNSHGKGFKNKVGSFSKRKPFVTNKKLAHTYGVSSDDHHGFADFSATQGIKMSHLIGCGKRCSKNLFPIRRGEGYKFSKVREGSLFSSHMVWGYLALACCRTGVQGLLSCAEKIVWEKVLHFPIDSHKKYPPKGNRAVCFHPIRRPHLDGKLSSHPFTPPPGWRAFSPLPNPPLAEGEKISEFSEVLTPSPQSQFSVTSVSPLSSPSVSSLESTMRLSPSPSHSSDAALVSSPVNQLLPPLSPCEESRNKSSTRWKILQQAVQAVSGGRWQKGGGISPFISILRLWSCQKISPVEMGVLIQAFLSSASWRLRESTYPSSRRTAAVMMRDHLLEIDGGTMKGGLWSQTRYEHRKKLELRGQEGIQLAQHALEMVLLAQNERLLWPAAQQLFQCLLPFLPKTTIVAYDTWKPLCLLGHALHLFPPLRWADEHLQSFAIRVIQAMIQSLRSLREFQLIPIMWTQDVVRHFRLAWNRVAEYPNARQRRHRHDCVENWHFITKMCDLMARQQAILKKEGEVTVEHRKSVSSIHTSHSGMGIRLENASNHSNIKLNSTKRVITSHGDKTFGSSCNHGSNSIGGGGYNLLNSSASVEQIGGGGSSPYTFIQSRFFQEMMLYASMPAEYITVLLDILFCLPDAITFFVESPGKETNPLETVTNKKKGGGGHAGIRSSGLEAGETTGWEGDNSPPIPTSLNRNTWVKSPMPSKGGGGGGGRLAGGKSSRNGIDSGIMGEFLSGERGTLNDEELWLSHPSIFHKCEIPNIWIQIATVLHHQGGIGLIQKLSQWSKYPLFSHAALFMVKILVERSEYDYAYLIAHYSLNSIYQINHMIQRLEKLSMESCQGWLRRIGLGNPVYRPSAKSLESMYPHPTRQSGISLSSASSPPPERSSLNLSSNHRTLFKESVNVASNPNHNRGGGKRYINKSHSEHPESDVTESIIGPTMNRNMEKGTGQATNPHRVTSSDEEISIYPLEIIKTLFSNPSQQRAIITLSQRFAVWRRRKLFQLLRRHYLKTHVIFQAQLHGELAILHETALGHLKVILSSFMGLNSLPEHIPLPPRLASLVLLSSAFSVSPNNMEGGGIGNETILTGNTSTTHMTVKGVSRTGIREKNIEETLHRSSQAKGRSIPNATVSQVSSTNVFFPAIRRGLGHRLHMIISTYGGGGGLSLTETFTSNSGAIPNTTGGGGQSNLALTSLFLPVREIQDRCDIWLREAVHDAIRSVVLYQRVAMFQRGYASSLRVYRLLQMVFTSYHTESNYIGWSWVFPQSITLQRSTTSHGSEASARRKSESPHVTSAKSGKSPISFGIRGHDEKKRIQSRLKSEKKPFSLPVTPRIQDYGFEIYVYLREMYDLMSLVIYDNIHPLKLGELLSPEYARVGNSLNSEKIFFQQSTALGIFVSPKGQYEEQRLIESIQAKRRKTNVVFLRERTEYEMQETQYRQIIKSEWLCELRKLWSNAMNLEELNEHEDLIPNSARNPSKQVLHFSSIPKSLGSEDRIDDNAKQKSIIFSPGKLSESKGFHSMRTPLSEQNTKVPRLPLPPLSLTSLGINRPEPGNTIQWNINALSESSEMASLSHATTSKEYYHSSPFINSSSSYSHPSPCRDQLAAPLWNNLEQALEPCRYAWKTYKECEDNKKHIDILEDPSRQNFAGLILSVVQIVMYSATYAEVSDVSCDDETVILEKQKNINKLVNLSSQLDDKSHEDFLGSSQNESAFTPVISSLCIHGIEIAHLLVRLNQISYNRFATMLLPVAIRLLHKIQASGEAELMQTLLEHTQFQTPIPRILALHSLYGYWNKLVWNRKERSRRFLSASSLQKKDHCFPMMLSNMPSNSSLVSLLDHMRGWSTPQERMRFLQASLDYMNKDYPNAALIPLLCEDLGMMWYRHGSESKARDYWLWTVDLTLQSGNAVAQWGKSSTPFITTSTNISKQQTPISMFPNNRTSMAHRFPLPSEIGIYQLFSAVSALASLSMLIFHSNHHKATEACILAVELLHYFFSSTSCFSPQSLWDYGYFSIKKTLSEFEFSLPFQSRFEQITQGLCFIAHHLLEAGFPSGTVVAAATAQAFAISHLQSITWNVHSSLLLSRGLTGIGNISTATCVLMSLCRKLNFSVVTEYPSLPGIGWGENASENSRVDGKGSIKGKGGALGGNSMGSGANTDANASPEKLTSSLWHNRRLDRRRSNLIGGTRTSLSDDAGSMATHGIFLKDTIYDDHLPSTDPHNIQAIDYFVSVCVTDATPKTMAAMGSPGQVSCAVHLLPELFVHNVGFCLSRYTLLTIIYVLVAIGNHHSSLYTWTHPNDHESTVGGSSFGGTDKGGNNPSFTATPTLPFRGPMLNACLTALWWADRLVESLSLLIKSEIRSDPPFALNRAQMRLWNYSMMLLDYERCGTTTQEKSMLSLHLMYLRARISHLHGYAAESISHIFPLLKSPSCLSPKVTDNTKHQPPSIPVSTTHRKTRDDVILFKEGDYLQYAGCLPLYVILPTDTLYGEMICLLLHNLVMLKNWDLSLEVLESYGIPLALRTQHTALRRELYMIEVPICLRLGTPEIAFRRLEAAQQLPYPGQLPCGFLVSESPDFICQETFLTQADSLLTSELLIQEILEHPFLENQEFRARFFNSELLLNRIGELETTICSLWGTGVSYGLTYMHSNRTLKNSLQGPLFFQIPLETLSSLSRRRFVIPQVKPFRLLWTLHRCLNVLAMHYWRIQNFSSAESTFRLALSLINYYDAVFFLQESCFSALQLALLIYKPFERKLFIGDVSMAWQNNRRKDSTENSLIDKKNPNGSIPIESTSQVLSFSASIKNTTLGAQSSSHAVNHHPKSSKSSGSAICDLETVCKYLGKIHPCLREMTLLLLWVIDQQITHGIHDYSMLRVSYAILYSLFQRIHGFGHLATQMLLMSFISFAMSCITHETPHMLDSIGKKNHSSPLKLEETNRFSHQATQHSLLSNNLSFDFPFLSLSEAKQAAQLSIQGGVMPFFPSFYSPSESSVAHPFVIPLHIHMQLRSHEWFKESLSSSIISESLLPLSKVKADMAKTLTKGVARSMENPMSPFSENKKASGFFENRHTKHDFTTIPGSGRGVKAKQSAGVESPDNGFYEARGISENVTEIPLSVLVSTFSRIVQDRVVPGLNFVTACARESILVSLREIIQSRMPTLTAQSLRMLLYEWNHRDQGNSHHSLLATCTISGSPTSGGASSPHPIGYNPASLSSKPITPSFFSSGVTSPSSNTPLAFPILFHRLPSLLQVMQLPRVNMILTQNIILPTHSARVNNEEHDTSDTKPLPLVDMHIVLSRHTYYRSRALTSGESLSDSSSTPFLTILPVSHMGNSSVTDEGTLRSNSRAQMTQSGGSIRGRRLSKNPLRKIATSTANASTNSFNAGDFMDLDFPLPELDSTSVNVLTRDGHDADEDVPYTTTFSIPQLVLQKLYRKVCYLRLVLRTQLDHTQHSSYNSPTNSFPSGGDSAGILRSTVKNSQEASINKAKNPMHTGLGQDTTHVFRAMSYKNGGSQGYDKGLPRWCFPTMTQEAPQGEKDVERLQTDLLLEFIEWIVVGKAQNDLTRGSFRELLPTIPIDVEFVDFLRNLLNPNGGAVMLNSPHIHEWMLHLVQAGLKSRLGKHDG